MHDSHTSPGQPARDQEQTETAPPAESGDLDTRFNHGLIFDVVKVLESHGYKLPPVEGNDPTDHNRALGQTVGALLRLVRTFEGADL